VLKPIFSACRVGTCRWLAVSYTYTDVLLWYFYSSFTLDWLRRVQSSLTSASIQHAVGPKLTVVVQHASLWVVSSQWQGLPGLSDGLALVYK